MKKILFALASLTAFTGCRHTVQENYTMINKVVGELTVITDSISYLHNEISATLPGSETHIEKDKKGTRYSEDYVASVLKSGDTASSQKMKRYSILIERYNTYKEMFGLIYRELPKDSAAKNEAIKRQFEESIKL